MAHVTEPLHSPDAYHGYELNSTGCIRVPSGSSNGVQVIDETIPDEHIGVWLGGGTVESIFFTVRDTLVSEFMVLREQSGRDVARQNFGGSSRLKRFTDRVLVGTLPITPTVINLALGVCHGNSLLPLDGHVFLVMLLLFGEDVLSKDLPE